MFVTTLILFIYCDSRLTGLTHCAPNCSPSSSRLQGPGLLTEILEHIDVINRLFKGCDDGLIDFSEMFNAGQIKLLAERTFDASKQYLWPIPSSEIEINPKMDQNSGY